MRRKFLQNHKNDDLVEEVQFLDANPQYANIRYRDSRKSSVSLSDLSPCPQGLNSHETESRFPTLDEEDPQISPVQQGKDDLLRTARRNLPRKGKVVMLPLINTKIHCNRTTTTFFSLPLPNQLCADRLGQLRVLHPFDMESRFLIKRGRLLCNCDCDCNCVWSSPKHVLDLSFVQCVLFLSWLLQNAVRATRGCLGVLFFNLCCLFLC